MRWIVPVWFLFILFVIVTWVWSLHAAISVTLTILILLFLEILERKFLNWYDAQETTSSRRLRAFLKRRHLA